uniref:DUF5659 domain-containing protein n=1 Tax=Heterorhabditis bacteriophora TaxID=37862 RepID=A0A1I7WEE5_HETBA
MQLASMAALSLADLQGFIYLLNDKNVVHIKKKFVSEKIFRRLFEKSVNYLDNVTECQDKNS